ncbi:MAG TPA: outer-membrane lipoprotein carrier protein LolA, partial [Pseudolabrys sp.]
MSRTTSRAAILGAIALLTAAAAVTPAFTSALAQPADASKPAPAAKPAHKPQAAKPKPANTAQQTPQRAAPPMQAEPPAIRPNPVAALFGKTGESATITPEQRALVDKINAYMSGMQNLNGSFIQVGPDGKKSQGTFYIQKPGKVRFEYDPPSPMELIADGDSVVVRDRNLATQDVYPLSQTPLRFLLADRVNLLRDTNLLAVYADDVFITAV